MMTATIKEMSPFELNMLAWELKQLCRSDVLRTDAESVEADSRKREICQIFGEMFPEDVLERFSLAPDNVWAD